MAPTNKILLVSAIVVIVMSCSAQGQLSKHDDAVTKSITKALTGKVSTNCLIGAAEILFSNLLQTDTYIDNLCKVTLPKKKNDIVSDCEESGYNKIVAIACPIIKQSNDDRAKLVQKYDAMYKKLSTTCQKKAGGKDQFKTWYNIETDCDVIKKGKKDYEKACPKGDYGNLKTAVCGGASGIISSLATLSLCLVAYLFNKL